MAQDEKGGLAREFSAGGVVFKRGPQVEWLLGKHSGYHKWVLPKGLIEEGEKGLATALREVEEEMGIKARPKGEKPIHKTEYFFWDSGRRVFKRVSFYLMEYEAGDTKNHGWEMEQARWLPYQKALKLLAFEGEREALQKAHKILEAR